MIALTREPIDVEAVRRAVEAPEHGGIVLFLGEVRNHAWGRAVHALEYEAYEPMALCQMERLAQEARERWNAKVAFVHRLGRLEIGEVAVAIAVGTPHRAEAFECARWLIETLKQEVPIWKREFTEEGAYWVEGEGGQADDAP